MGNKATKFNRSNLEQAKLQPGDIIKMSRTTLSNIRGYYHFAIYVGEGYIVHLTKTKKEEYCKCPDDLTFVEDNTETVCKHCKKDYRCVVKSEPLEAALDKSEFIIANNFDSTTSPRADTLVRAASVLGPVKYNVFRHNCEHFVNWCRYNNPFSAQSLIKWFNKKKYEQIIKFKKFWQKQIRQ